MQDPFGPGEGEEPPDPLDDPMLDELERRIENPPGLHDPLAETDPLRMDGMGNPPPLLPAPELVQDVDLPGLERGDPRAPVPPVPIEETEPPAWTSGPPPLPEEPSPEVRRARIREPRQPRRGGRLSRPRKLPVLRRSPGLAGRTLRTARSHIRYCPESDNLIAGQQCRSCDKYRHWPDGTDEEPRECWHDWQAHPSADEDLDEHEQD